MKRIAAVFALLALCALSVTAGEMPVAAQESSMSPPPMCSMTGMEAIGVPQPMNKDYIPPPCIGYTECPGGGNVQCSNVSYSNCWYSPGCWVDCNEEGFIFCPGRAGEPECMIW